MKRRDQEIVDLDVYAKLAERLAIDLFDKTLEARALGYQLRAVQLRLKRERERERWWQRWR